MAMAPLNVESWIWYSLTWIIVISRLLSRRILRGSIRKLQIDDAIVLVIMITDTILIVCMNVLSRTSSNLIPPDEVVDLTPKEIHERVLGSKLVLLVEQMQCITIWLVKACLLIMYGRLTMNLKQKTAVKIVSVYVAVGFVIMEILYLGVWCRPIQNYWAVPVDNPQCSAATNHLITNAILNITSDIMIILIPMPIFLEARLPVKKKLILCGIFGLGIFTILSAILNKFYSFTQPFGSEWTFWYIRESSTAIMAANLPFVWTLLQRTFNLRSWSHRSGRRTGYSNGSQYAHQRHPSGTGGGGYSRSSRRTSSRRHTHLNTSFRNPNNLNALEEGLDDISESELARSDSQERIISPNKKSFNYDADLGSNNKNTKSPSSMMNMPLEPLHTLQIYQKREVFVESHPASPTTSETAPAERRRPSTNEAISGIGGGARGPVTTIQ